MKLIISKIRQRLSPHSEGSPCLFYTGWAPGDKTTLLLYLPKGMVFSYPVFCMSHSLSLCLALSAEKVEHLRGGLHSRIPTLFRSIDG